MPLTAPRIDPYEEERKRAQALFAQEQQAGAGITGGLEKMQELARQADLDAQAKAQKAAENKRADEHLVLEKTTAEGNAKRADNELVLRQSQDARAAAEAQRKAADDARTQALAHVKSAIAAQMETAGPKADITSVMNQFAGQPGFEAIRPEDVQGAHAEAVREFTQRAAERGDKDAAAALAKMKADEDARHNKAMEGVAWTSAKNAAEAAKDKKPAQLMAKDEMVKSAAASLDSLERNLAAYDKNTTLPIEGPGALLRRVPLIGRLADQEDQAKAKADAAAVNSLLFPILGRTDAPSDPENKQLEALKIDIDHDTPTQRAAKIATIRRMLGGAGAGPPPVADDPAQHKAVADSYFGGG